MINPFVKLTFLGMSLLAASSAAAFSWTVPSRYSHFIKRLAPSIYTGGKLTERQVEYLAEAGFKSILITLPQDEPLDSFNGMAGPFPSSAQEAEIAAKLGMTAVAMETQMTVESAMAVSDAILAMQKPIYVHCGVGWGASLFAELHLFRTGVTPAEEVFTNSLTLGWDYQANADAVALVNAFTQINPPATVQDPILELTLAEGEDSYKSYYWSHRVGNDSWYNIGQVLESHVDTIAAAGYKTVISFRNNGEATQRTSSDPATGAVDNGEFSDADGNYNVTAEQEAFTAVGVQFLNLPVTGDMAWSAEQLALYTPQMLQAAARGPVLAHCTSGYRSSAYVTAFLAQQQNLCTTWALTQARRVGYSFDVNEDDAKVMQFYQDGLKDCEQ
mmetsp:Transcript_11137/g.18190  ORF Transcript_11137/g.18190 Transcript_11137/m.18190 type:complete len:387 (-) Transcript_11137:945-2105(-)